MRLSKIVTKTGDDGKTNLGTKKRLSKDHIHIEVLGTLDELNCAIGLIVVTQQNTKSISKILTQIQNDLFDIGGELCPPYQVAITNRYTQRLEKTIHRWNNKLPPLKEFVLPGGTMPSAFCHLARAICRRAERRLVSLHRKKQINTEILQYINRLSDLLFVVARVMAREKVKKEKMWDPHLA